MAGKSFDLDKKEPVVGYWSGYVEIGLWWSPGEALLFLEAFTLSFILLRLALAILSEDLLSSPPGISVSL